jgi:sulfoxide reductase heme-binding subunit YedZ
MTTYVAAPLIGKSTLWFLSRSTGFVLLGLFTVTVVLGLLTAGRIASPRWPRFVTESLHRNVSMIAMVLLVVHVGAVVIDHYVKVDLIDVFVPFLSAYQPLWLGLGTLALDIVVLLGVSSLLRVRFGYRVWRTIHWSAYAFWPLAVSHGIGAGTDRPYLLAFTVFCAAFVALAGAYRVAGGRRVALTHPA